jgi:cyanate permease
MVEDFALSHSFSFLYKQCNINLKRRLSMKKLPVRVLLTIALSLAILTYFRYQFPDVKLTPSATVLVVGICAVIVQIAGWIRTQNKKRVRKGKGRHIIKAEN